MNSDLNKEAILLDKNGKKKILRKTRHGWQVKRVRTTPLIALNRKVGERISKNIRYLRKEKNMTMKELGTQAGILNDAKQRIWAIEHHLRGEGIRLGTVYALAFALDCEITDILPAKEEVRKNV